MSGVPALLAAAGAYGLASAGWRLALQTALARALAEGPAASGGGPDGRARAYGALVWVSNAGAVPAMVGTRSSSWYATGQLLKRLSEEASSLVRQELAPARAELVQNGRQAGMAVGLLGAAAAAGLAALSALTGLLILALALAVDTWLAALIVTVG